MFEEQEKLETLLHENMSLMGNKGKTLGNKLSSKRKNIIE